MTSEKPTIYNYMDCSTGHVTWKDQILLCEDAERNAPNAAGVDESFNHGLIVYNYDSGFWVHCYSVQGTSCTHEERAASAKTGGYSEYLIALLKWAGESGCTFLRLDSDGEGYDTLPTFDWEAERATGQVTENEE